MIGAKEINPLNVLKAREMKYLPNHFSEINLPFKREKYNIGVYDSARDIKIRDWIYKNLKGRFYVGNYAKIIEKNNPYDFEMIVAFEKSSELSFFILACPEAVV